jgi:hypothetical protein
MLSGQFFLGLGTLAEAPIWLRVEPTDVKYFPGRKT